MKSDSALFFSCLLKWMVIISFVSLYVLYCYLLVFLFFMYISFSMDVFIVIISFLALCLVFSAFHPKMFIIGLLSEFLLSFFIMGSKVFHISAVIERVNNCFVLFVASITHWWYVVFAFSVIICFWLTYNILCSNL